MKRTCTTCGAEQATLLCGACLHPSDRHQRGSIEEEQLAGLCSSPGQLVRPQRPLQWLDVQLLAGTIALGVALWQVWERHGHRR